ncbi:MAG: shikimate kinase [Pseudomonadota bacterium]
MSEPTSTTQSISTEESPQTDDSASTINSIVMVGIMGAGKSAVGRRLAERLGLPFVDADTEIEAAAGCSIEDIFERFGEGAFREGERRVVARLLGGAPKVLATGGGAFMDPETRAHIKEAGISVWLTADIDVLFERVMRRSGRPLLKQDDPRGVLERLLIERSPIYAEADIVVASEVGPISRTVDKVEHAVRAHLSSHPSRPGNQTAAR